MSHHTPPPPGPSPQDGGRGPTPAGVGGKPGRGAGKEVDPVDAEWSRIEDERVAGEVAEAREDVIEAITDRGGRRGAWRWMWWAFAAALVAGIVFAGWVDLVVAMNRPTPDTALPAPAVSGPSPSESGPGTAGDGDDGVTTQNDDAEPETSVEPGKSPGS